MRPSWLNNGLPFEWLRIAMVVVAVACGAPSPGLAQTEDAGIKFFESKIRPVLVAQCYECHSAESKSPKGGLRVDSRQALLTGGESGPAVVPGDLEESLLLTALRHDGLAMPPSNKLPAETIADFEAWIKLGAPDPREGAAPVARSQIDLEAGRRFWAFRPVVKPSVPAVADDRWSLGEIDRFLWVAMREKGIAPVADADRPTWLRRVTFDLTGLPPTPEELRAFVADASTDAYAHVVDRLLASPRYGERWGRHWLDVARYADSNGKDENFTFHNAWRYRDYVVDSFNRDKPFNRFVMEQVAGDLLPANDPQQRDEQAIATGLLVLGPKVLAERDKVKLKYDVLDEQIDTVGRAFLALTLGCARCHDHKFDPIPTADYYALAGILGSTTTLEGMKGGNVVISGWAERPLGTDGVRLAEAWAGYQKRLTTLEKDLKKAQSELKKHSDKAMMKEPAIVTGIVVDDAEAQRIGFWKASVHQPLFVGVGYIHDDKQGKGEKSVTFTPDLPREGEYEVQLAYTAVKGRATNVPVTIRHAGGEATVTVNQEETPSIEKLFRPLGKYRFAAGKQGAVVVSNAGTTGYVIVDAVRWVPLGDTKEAMLAAEMEKKIGGVPAEVRQQLEGAKSRVAALEDEIKALKAAAPQQPDMAMAVKESAEPQDCRICIRGSSEHLGAVVPRGFLSVCTSSPPGIPDGQSGRLQLAQWLADSKNPLTARVMVNRVWQHLFGVGIVRTVDNFGKQGELPSHPELLDFLASRFVDDGWSVKRLVRAIVLSHAYRLSSVEDAQAAKVDVEDRLLWRARRRRLEAEPLRDAMLWCNGQLDGRLGGSSVAHLGERAIDNTSQGSIDTETSVRRAMYLPIIRNELPQMLAVFDVADADVSTGQRDTTTVATQALYLMNSPFALEQARHMARWLLDADVADDGARLTSLYRRALGRDPSDSELATLRVFLDDYRLRARAKGSTEQDATLAAWQAVCQAMFGCTEFRFID